jgi:hyperosmotically inducible protein
MKRSILTRTLVAAFALGSALPMAATTAFAAGATEKGNDSNQPVNDTWITTKVKAELATTDGVKSNDIDVKTVNGVVTLTGMLPTDVAVKKAVAAAESIQGVKKVDHSGLKSK